VNIKIVEFRSIGVTQPKTHQKFSAEIINEIDSFIFLKLESIFMYVLQKKKQKYKEVLFPLSSVRSGC